jgi:hypothetical protein
MLGVFIAWPLLTLVPALLLAVLFVRGRGRVSLVLSVWSVVSAVRARRRGADGHAARLRGDLDEARVAPPGGGH